MRLNFSLLLLCGLAFGGPTVNDITRLNPIEVDRVVSPKSITELVEVVKNHKGTISIAGGRFSQGGQTALEHSLNLDMTAMDKVIEFKPEKKEITVEAGITWKKIQRHIDPKNLAIQIMQTYSNFTVGGSLSVNVHGRYIGGGPVIGSVKNFKIVMANGKVIEASPTKNTEIFYGAIGGYGGLGVIATVTLALADNVNVERTHQKMPIAEYKKYFFEKVRENPDVVFHNTDIYPPAFERVRAVSWLKTDKPVTEPTRLIEQTENSFVRKFFISMINSWPFGKTFREYVMDPWLFREALVYRRNFEASYDVIELDPFAKDKTTYVLQEYFVPVDKFDEFVPKMRSVFQKNHVNIFNVSIRHAKQDPGSLMAWARKETFAFVVYYSQGYDEKSRQHVAYWTREMIDAVLSCDGAYYLPYQIHASDPQFFKAYPRAKDFFALKAKLDPTVKFKNKLWERYLTPNPPPYVKMSSGYKLRPEEQTFMTVPEWYIVFSSDEYAQHLKKLSPTSFPWFASIGQFWGVAAEVGRRTKGIYRTNWEYRTMTWVIGASFTAEYLLKGLYENTFGRVTAWFATSNGEFHSSADNFMRRMQQEYVAFIRLRPWYEFSFLKYFTPLWHEPVSASDSFIRRWERRFFYSAEILAKSMYGWVIQKASQSAYHSDDLEIQALIKGDAEKFKRIDSRLKARDIGHAGYFVATLPRYEPFTELIPKISDGDFTFYEIAGNQKIVATFIAPTGNETLKPLSENLYRWPILTQTGLERQMVTLNTKQLLQALRNGKEQGITLDHTFDY